YDNIDGSEDYIAFVNANHADNDVIINFNTSFDKIDLSNVLTYQDFQYVTTGSPEAETLEEGELRARDGTMLIEGETIDGAYLEGWVDHDDNGTNTPDFQIFIEHVDQATLDATHDDWLIA
ncbi:hypothetical protein TI05_08580, partial [Achromatium sp. WMS3]